MSNGESMWFKIVVILVAAATIGVSIANLIYYNRLRNGTSNAISHGEALTMFWINIVLLVLAVIVFLLAIWRIISPGKCTTTQKLAAVHTAHTESTAPTHLAYTNPDGQQVIKPIGHVTGEATSTYASANVIAPGEASSLARQEQYY